MLKNLSLPSYNGLKKDYFTNGCKKTQKLVRAAKQTHTCKIVYQKLLKRMVKKVVFKDINVLTVIIIFHHHEDHPSYKK